MTKTDTSREAGLTELEQIANDEARHAHRDLIERLTERAERAEAERDAGLIREKDANTRAMQNLRRAEKAEIASKNYAEFNHVWRRRAERAEAGLKEIEREWDPSEDSINAKTMYEIANATLAQLDAEPAGVSEPVDVSDTDKAVLRLMEKEKLRREVWEQAKEAAAQYLESQAPFTEEQISGATSFALLDNISQVDRSRNCRKDAAAIRAMEYPGDSQ